MRKTWLTSAGLIRIIMAVLLLTLLTACIGIPDRVDSDRSEVPPVLWLYEQEPGAELATLYRKAPGEAPQLIAEHVVPGSHRLHAGSLLLLDGAKVLHYLSEGQGTHPLLDGIEPFSYGFVNDGRQVFAITERRELLLKTFGLEPQLLIEHVEHAVPLSDRLIALTDGGQVHSFDYYGAGSVIAVGAQAVGVGPDERHAVIYLRSGDALVTDGKDASVVIDQAGFGPIRITGDGRFVAYLDHYDDATGLGTLMLLTRHESGDSVELLADEVGQFAWEESGCCLWYVREGSLYRHRTGDRETSLIQDRIEQFVTLRNGLLAAITTDGELQIYDRNGEQIWQRSEEEPIEWVRPFASGVLFGTGRGITAYWDAERQREELGMVPRLSSDGRTIVGMRHHQAIAWDLKLQQSVLLEDARPYRYVYYGEQLLSEKLVQLQELEGVWIAEDGRKLEIERAGESRGYLAFDEGEPVPFYVIYVSHDSLRLMVADLTNRTMEVTLQADGSLLLAMSDGWSKVYLRSDRDVSMPERIRN